MGEQICIFKKVLWVFQVHSLAWKSLQEEESVNWEIQLSQLFGSVTYYPYKLRQITMYLRLFLFCLFKYVHACGKKNRISQSLFYHNGKNCREQLLMPGAFLSSAVGFALLQSLRAVGNYLSIF